MAQLVLKSVLQRAGVPQVEVARSLGISSAAMTQLLNHNIWPRRRTRLDLETAMLAWLKARSVQIAPGVFEEAQPPRANAAAAGSNESRPKPAKHQGGPHTSANEGVDMLLEPQQLTQRARERFGLRRNPFEQELTDYDDIFLTVAMRERVMDMESAILRRRFIAIHGESGSGKTTLRLLLQHMVQGQAIVVNPRSTVGMAPDDRKGQTLRIADIYRAIMMSLEPSESMARERELRSHQVLAALLDAGKPVCLVIEEAHRMPVVTLKSLKSLREAADSLHPTLGVLLVGQSELVDRLNHPQLREIGQRAERCEVKPLGKHLSEYMAHLCKRAGVDFDRLFGTDAVDALASHKHMVRRQLKRSNGTEGEVTESLTHPLRVNNAAISLLNFAASLGAPKVDAELVREWTHEGS